MKPSFRSGFGFIRRGDQRDLFFHFSTAVIPRQHPMRPEEFDQLDSYSLERFRPQAGDEVAYVEDRDHDGRPCAAVVIPAGVLREARAQYATRRRERLAREERERRRALEDAARHAALAVQPSVGCDLAAVTLAPANTRGDGGQLHLAEAVTRYAGVPADGAWTGSAVTTDDTLHFWSQRPWRECGGWLKDITPFLSPAGLDRLVGLIPALCTPRRGHTRQAVQEWARTRPVTWLLEQVRLDLAQIWADLPTRDQLVDAAVRVAGCRHIAAALATLPRGDEQQSLRIQGIVGLAMRWAGRGLGRQPEMVFVGPALKAVADVAPAGAADHIEREFFAVIEGALARTGQEWPELFGLGLWEFRAQDPQPVRRPCGWTQQHRGGYTLACARWAHADGPHYAFVADGAEPVWGLCRRTGEELPVHFCHIPRPTEEQVTCLFCGTVVRRHGGEPFANLGEDLGVVYDDNGDETYYSNGGRYHLRVAPWRRVASLYDVPPYLEVQFIAADS